MRPLDVDSFPSIPRDEDGPVFHEPWEAQAFGMTLVLHESGHFTWREWTNRLSAEITAAKARGEEDDGSRYYLYWLTALEKLVAEKRLVPTDELAVRKHEMGRGRALNPARPADRAARALTSGALHPPRAISSLSDYTMSAEQSVSPDADLAPFGRFGRRR